jgi:hypothetical protein
MHLALLALVLVATPQEPVLDGGTQVVNLAPTLANTSLLGSMAAQPSTEITVVTPADSTLAEDPRPRTKAVEYSDLYYARLKIHQIASYLTVPVFVAQYFVGQRLMKHPGQGGGAKAAHGALATAVGGLFAVNTVTGVWNLWDSRKDPQGRARRWVHGIAMLVADAGFVAVASSAPDDDWRENGGTPSSGRSNSHRNLAIGSMSLALASGLMMYIWKD